MLTDDAQIRVLNRDWRGKNKATDVLSFPQVTEKDLRSIARASKKGKIPEWWLGDVVISVERTAKQAREHGYEFREELELLLAHGLLHLLGYDHELGAKEARKMRFLETKLLGRSMILE